MKLADLIDLVMTKEAKQIFQQSIKDSRKDQEKILEKINE